MDFAIFDLETLKAKSMPPAIVNGSPISSFEILLNELHVSPLLGFYGKLLRVIIGNSLDARLKVSGFSILNLLE